MENHLTQECKHAQFYAVCNNWIMNYYVELRILHAQHILSDIHSHVYTAPYVVAGELILLALSRKKFDVENL